MTALLNVLEDFLQWQGTKYLRLDGNTKADDRGEMLRLFNAPVCLLARPALVGFCRCYRC